MESLNKSFDKNMGELEKMVGDVKFNADFKKVYASLFDTMKVDDDMVLAKGDSLVKFLINLS